MRRSPRCMHAATATSRCTRARAGPIRCSRRPGSASPCSRPAYSGPLDYLDAKHHWLVRARPAPVAQPYAYYHPSMRWAEPDLEHAIEGLRWISTHRAAARASAANAAARLQEEFSAGADRRGGQGATARAAGAHRRRARAGGRRAGAATPRAAAPIPGSWYDADYFEHGQTSNWQHGYTWPLFRGVFTDAAGFLGEMFPEARSFLDIGCAKGFLVRALRERGLEACGLRSQRLGHRPRRSGNAAASSARGR